MTTDKLRVTGIFLSFACVICCVVDIIYWFSDFTSDDSRIDLLAFCLIRQLILIVPLVIYELVGLICYLKRKKERRK